MSRLLSELLLKLSERKSLEAVRESLTKSIPHNYGERRIAPRLPVSKTLPQKSPAGVLLDLSSTGMAIEAPAICRYARGELHRFILRAGAGTVEVDGKVCWTRSDWRDASRNGTSAYLQKAGLEFSDKMSNEVIEILRILQGMVENQNIPVEVRSSQVVKPCIDDAEVDVTPGFAPE